VLFPLPSSERVAGTAPVPAAAAGDDAAVVPAVVLLGSEEVGGTVAVAGGSVAVEGVGGGEVVEAVADDWAGGNVQHALTDGTRVIVVP